MGSSAAAAHLLGENGQNSDTDIQIFIVHLFFLGHTNVG